MKIGRYLSPLVFSFCWSLSLTIWFWQRECRFSLYRLPDALQCKLVHLLYFNSAKLRFKLSLISSMISFSSEQSILEAVPQKFRVCFFFFLKYILREEYVALLVKLFLLISLKIFSDSNVFGYDRGNQIPCTLEWGFC